MSMLLLHRLVEKCGSVDKSAFLYLIQYTVPAMTSSVRR